MRIRLSFSPFCALVLTAATASAEVDFTLQRRAMQTDAIAVDKPYITDGASKIYLQYPGNWQVFDGADGLDFTPNGSNARIRLGRYQGSELTIDEAGARALLQQINARVPKEATNVVALPANYNPLPLFGWTDLEVTVRYDFYGQTVRQSLMYVHMKPGRLIEFSMTAPDKEFEGLYRPARSVLSSWFEPSRDLPPELARQYEELDQPK